MKARLKSGNTFPISAKKVKGIQEFIGLEVMPIGSNRATQDPTDKVISFLAFEQAYMAALYRLLFVQCIKYLENKNFKMEDFAELMGIVGHEKILPETPFRAMQDIKKIRARISKLDKNDNSLDGAFVAYLAALKWLDDCDVKNAVYALGMGNYIFGGQRMFFKLTGNHLSDEEYQKADEIALKYFRKKNSQIAARNPRPSRIHPDKAKIYEYWKKWRDKPVYYPNEAAFIRDMIEKTSVKSERSIRKWIVSWKSLAR